MTEDQREMFAMRRVDGHLHTFLPIASVYSTCGTDPVVRVRVTLDPHGEFWAWWSSEDERFRYVNSHREGVTICFPYGPEAEERRGRGVVCRVRVNVLRLATAEELA